MKRLVLFTATLALGGVALGPFGLGRSQEHAALAGPLGDDPDLIADVAEKVTPSVVNVSTTTVTTAPDSPWGSDPFLGDGDGQERLGKSLGSGVIVSAAGLILTNNHVIANARDIRVGLSDGEEYDATLVGADPKADLAVLKLTAPPKGLVPLTFGDSSRLRLGEVVLAVGNPFGVGQTVTMGIVSAVGRANMGIEDYEDFIQTDAAINPGNSGGALINLKGQLVGINTAILSRSGGSQGIGFAIPSDMAQPIMQMLVDKGRVVRGWLGVGIQDVDRALAETLELPQSRGVLLTSVADGGPADQAGLARGDLIVKLGDKPTHRTGNLRNAVAMAAGRTLAVEYFRGKTRHSTKVAVAEQPSQAPKIRPGDGGAVRPAGKLGLRGTPVTPQSKKTYGLPRDLDHGVVVTGVTPGSTAEQLGLRPGDVLLELNRAELKTPKDLEAAYKKAGRRLALLVYRDGAAVYLMLQK